MSTQGRHAPKTTPQQSGYVMGADGKTSANQLYSSYVKWHQKNKPGTAPLTFKEWVPMAIHKGILNKEGTFSADAAPAPTAKTTTAPAPKKTFMGFVKDHKLVIGVVAVAIVGFVGYKFYKKHHHKVA
jgi:hypothetical protein